MSRTAFRSIEAHGTITTTPSLRPRVCAFPEILLFQRIESSSCTCSMQDRGGIPKPPHPPRNPLPSEQASTGLLPPPHETPAVDMESLIKQQPFMVVVPFQSSRRTVYDRELLGHVPFNQRLMGQLTRSVPSSQCQGGDVSRNTFGQIEMDTQR